MTAIAYIKYIAIGAAFLGWSFLCYHQGGQGTRLAVADVRVKQDTAAAKTLAKDQTTVAQEAKTYEAAVADPGPVPAPVVRLCYYRTAPAAVPRATAAGSGPDASPDLRAAAAAPLASPVAGADIGKPLIAIPHACDAQVAGLQDYIRHVCAVNGP